MPIANCPLCKRLFNQSLNEPCPSCRESEEAAYAMLIDFLGRMPQATLAQAAADTGVDPEVIRRMVKSGRLVGFDSLAMSVLACQRCGASISAGRFCSPCQRELQAGLLGPR